MERLGQNQDLLDHSLKEIIPRKERGLALDALLHG